MRDKRIMVVGGGMRGKVIAAALIANGVDVVRVDELQIIPRPQITGVWVDEIATTYNHNTYGPTKKGRGGKMRRW